MIAVKKRLPRPSVAFDDYWSTAVERHAIYERRLSGMGYPWTGDPCFLRHRFCNVFRAADRTSQYVIDRVLRVDGEDLSARDVVARVTLFDLFKRVGTWEHVVSECGEPRWHGVDRVEQMAEIRASLDRLRAANYPIYTGAYVMPEPGYGCAGKHRNHLMLWMDMIRETPMSRFETAVGLRDVFDVFSGFASIGDFLGMQFAVDVNYGSFFGFSENQFCVPGPGARSGIRKCFDDPGDYDEAGIVALVTDRQREEFVSRGHEPVTLFGRPMHRIDVQNWFCETDKYLRWKRPDQSTKERIKQRYAPDWLSLPRPTFPAPWGLEDAIDEFFDSCRGRKGGR